MDMRPPDDNVSAVEINQQQMNLMTQLFQSVASMHHIDELFQWLAYAIAQRFQVALLQFWAAQMATPTGQLTVQLRTMVRLDASIPDQVVVNDHMVMAALRMLSERRNHRPQPVENIFSSHQVLLLKRYGLNYCIACFVSDNALLPPRSNEMAYEASPMLFSMVTLLFFRQLPHVDLAAAISQVLEQSVEIARNRGLLLPTHRSIRQPLSGVQQPFMPVPPSMRQTSPADQPPFTPAPFQQEARAPLDALIPRRKQSADTLLSNNPFASSRAVIKDKSAHRLYKAIDGFLYRSIL